jgi:hypothetical protein
LKKGLFLFEYFPIGLYNASLITAFKGKYLS